MPAASPPLRQKECYIRALLNSSVHRPAANQREHINGAATQKAQARKYTRHGVKILDIHAYAAENSVSVAQTFQTVQTVEGGSISFAYVWQRAAMLHMLRRHAPPRTPARARPPATRRTQRTEA